MGWLYMHHLDGHKGPKQYLDAQFTHEGNLANYRVLKSALCGMRVYYAAVETIRHDDGVRDVFAVVCLVRYNKRDKEGYIFGYKDMDETMGPCEAECPAAILDLLTPTEAPYAIEWRARCRAYTAKPTPKAGQTITFTQPLKFTDGAEIVSFKIVAPLRKGGRVMFWAANESGGYYRISNIKNRAYTLS